LGLVIYDKQFFKDSLGGVTASTWVLKLKEHTGAHVDLVKNVQPVIDNNYALAA
jgi:hypothetical protein